MAEEGKEWGVRGDDAAARKTRTMYRNLRTGMGLPSQPGVPSEVYMYDIAGFTRSSGTNAHGIMDPRRIARETETRRLAQTAEREQQRAEEEARRQAQAAEREAKAKEEAVRGAAIAASLAAMCADMEQLAGTEQKSTREIDRLLAQAAKAFENIGKVPAAERDARAERYRAARAKLVTRAGELREAEDWQRWTNVPKAEALIETAKQLLEAPATPDLGNRLRGLQALWKEVAPMPQRRSKELWEQFKAACDQVYDKVKGVRAVEQPTVGVVYSIVKETCVVLQCDAYDVATVVSSL